VCTHFFVIENSNWCLIVNSFLYNIITAEIEKAILTLKSLVDFVKSEPKKLELFADQPILHSPEPLLELFLMRPICVITEKLDSTSRSGYWLTSFPSEFECETLECDVTHRDMVYYQLEAALGY